jgi:hypothetical protein
VFYSAADIGFNLQPILQYTAISRPGGYEVYRLFPNIPKSKKDASCCKPNIDLIHK